MARRSRTHTESARVSRTFDVLVVVAVILLFMGAIHLHMELLVGDWDMFIDWKDRQSSAITADGLYSFITNAGAARIEGLELEVSARPIHGLSLNGSIGYTKAELTEDQANANILVDGSTGKKGDRIDQLAPKERGEFVIKEIERLRPSTKGKMEVTGVHSWPQYQFVEGCRHSYGPGMVTKYAVEMIKPHGRLHFAGEHCSDDGAATLVRHMRELDAGSRAENFSGQMRRAARAARAVANLGGPRFRQRDEFGNIFRRQRRMHAKNARLHHQQHAGREFAFGVVWQRVVECRRVGDADAGQQQRVAVGR